MTVLTNVLPIRRPRACHHVHSVPRMSSPDTSARLNTTRRCSLRKPSAIADASVWLECSAELFDVRAVNVLRIREAMQNIKLVEFVCPRRRTPHASLRFG